MIAKALLKWPENGIAASAMTPSPASTTSSHATTILNWGASSMRTNIQARARGLPVTTCSPTVETTRLQERIIAERVLQCFSALILTYLAKADYLL